MRSTWMVPRGPSVAPEDDMDMDLVKQEEFWPLVQPMVERQPEVAPDTAPPDNRPVANTEPPANAPPPVPVLVKRYPAWFPKVLESINISSRSSRPFIERLHSQLKDFSGPVAEETNPAEEVPNDARGLRP